MLPVLFALLYYLVMELLFPSWVYILPEKVKYQMRKLLQGLFDKVQSSITNQNRD